MNKLIIFLICVVSCSGFTQQKYTGQTIEEILTLPEEEIDLGLAVLLLAKEVYPDIDINNYLNLLDRMAYTVHKISGGSNDPDIRIGSMNTFLYRKGRWNSGWTFEYDPVDSLAQELRNKFLNKYLDAHIGSCVTMPMLHIVLAQRLGWPIYAVCSPKHFFCRYIAPGFEESNIDATVSGGFINDARYIREDPIPQKALDNGVYMRTLSHKEYLARLLTVTSNAFYRQDKIDKSLYFLQIAARLDSTDSAALWNLGTCHYWKAYQLRDRMNREIQMHLTAMELEQPIKQQNSLLPRNRKGMPDERFLTATSAWDIIRPPMANTNKTSGIITMPEVPSIPGQSTGLPGHPLTSNTPDNLLNDMSIFTDIEVKYVPQIRELLQIARSYRKQAKALGIVINTPELYYDSHPEIKH